MACPYRYNPTDTLKVTQVMFRLVPEYLETGLNSSPDCPGEYREFHFIFMEDN